MNASYPIHTDYTLYRDPELRITMQGYVRKVEANRLRRAKNWPAAYKPNFRYIATVR